MLSKGVIRSAGIRNFAVFFAVSCWIGAISPVSAPMIVAPVALGVGVLSRRRLFLFFLGGLAVAVLSFHAREGLKPVQPREWSGVVTLLSDPQDYLGRVLANVDSDVGRLQLTATGRWASIVRRTLVGRRLMVRGTLRELTHPDRLASRHVRMAFSPSQVSVEGDSELWRVPIDAVRGAILRGSEALPADQRPVYAGFVIGDDRGSSDEVVQSFEDSGLSHLLVVSGENVVFVIAIATPIASRLGRRSRVFALTAVLLLFAAVTRFEPSVLRATFMAFIAVVGAGSGRPVDSRRRLAVAVAVLIIVDPLLVESFGFRLSVAATSGIALLAPSIARRLRGPSWFQQVLSVTVAAQLAVAPFVIPVFGPMPLASIPANVLAEPIAGFVMMWGSSVGIVAGVLGGWQAWVLQLPVRAGVWWIMTVAKWCASLPLPRLTLPAIAAIGLSSVVIAWLQRSRFWPRLKQGRHVSAG
jgi:competence protein ComEC